MIRHPALRLLTAIFLLMTALPATGRMAESGIEKTGKPTVETTARPHATTTADDNARKGAVTDIVAHMRWAAAHVDTTFTDEASLLRAAADAAASLSNEPAYAAILRQAGAIVPGLADYAAFRLSKQLDTADRRRLSALDALATAAHSRLPDRPDAEARARYCEAVVAAASDTARAWRSIGSACRLLSKEAPDVPDSIYRTDRLLYGTLQAIFMYEFIEGDNPLRYAGLRRLERDALHACVAQPASADKAALFHYLFILRNSASYEREATEADTEVFPSGRPYELPDSVSTEDWHTGVWYLDAAYATASAAMGYSHPDALTMRMATLNAESADFNRLFTYALAYWPLGTPQAGEVKITQWLRRLMAGLTNEDTRMAPLLLNHYRTFYGTDSPAYADALNNLVSILMMEEAATGTPGRGSQFARECLRLSQSRDTADDKHLTVCDGLLTFSSLTDAKIFSEVTDELSRSLAVPAARPSWTRVRVIQALATRYAQNAEHEKAIHTQRCATAEAARLSGTIGRRYEAEACYGLASLYESSGSPADSTAADSCWKQTIAAYEEAGLRSFMPVMRRATNLANTGHSDEAAAIVKRLLRRERRSMRPAFTACAELFLGRLRLLEGNDGRSTRRLFEKAAPSFLADTAALPSVAVYGYVYLSAWHLYEDRPDSAAHYLSLGLEHAWHTTDAAVGLPISFVSELFTLYMLQGDDHKAEALNEQLIAYIEKHNLCYSTAYLDCLWNRYLITQQRTPGDFLKLFDTCNEQIKPTMQVYIRSHQNNEIKYTYLLRLFCNLMSTGIQIYKLDIPNQQADTTAQATLRRTLTKFAPTLIDLETGYPAFIQEADYRLLSDYQKLIQTLADYYTFIDPDTARMAHYYRLVAEAKTASGMPWEAARTMTNFHVLNGDFDKALPYNTQVYEQLNHYAPFARMQICRWQSELCYVAQRDEEAARAACDYADEIRRYVLSNFDYLSSDERSRFLSDHSVSGLMVGWLLPRQPKRLSGPAYDAALFDKGLLLHSWERVRRSIFNSGDAGLIARLDTLSTLTEALRRVDVAGGGTESTTRMFELNQRIQDIEKELARQTAQFRTDTMRTTTWQQVRDGLLPSDAAVEFVATDTALAALIIRPGMERPAVVTLDSANRVASLLSAADRLPADTRARRLYTYGSSLLYDLVWRPLVPHLRGARRVYYSPTGVLHRVAFAALPISPDSCLTDRHELHLVSTTAEVLRPHRNPPIRTAALFGGIHYSPDQGVTATTPDTSKQRAAIEETFNYLEETRRETDAIARDLAQANVSLKHFTGDNATEAAFYQLDGTNTDIIHLATHGFYIDARNAGTNAFLRNHSGGLTSSMQRTGLAFAGANATWEGVLRPDSDDGILTAGELSLLDLSGTYLVVLSACETALGDYNTEGVWGLQRGFKEAGARSLLLSLWNVSDAATATLMQDFYRRWLGGTPKGKAFRQAVDALRRTHPNPFYWAAFVMLDADD